MKMISQDKKLAKGDICFKCCFLSSEGSSFICDRFDFVVDSRVEVCLAFTPISTVSERFKAKPIEKSGRKYGHSEEIDWGKDNYCSDCGADEGELHRFICNYELCPFCGHQYKSCDCKAADSLLDDFETEEELRSGKKRRVPHIIYPSICARCGALWPDLFRVPDEEWERYIRIDMRDKVICRSCFDYIKRLIDKGTRKIED